MTLETRQYVLNHYDHAESVAAGRRIFSEKLSGREVVEVGLEEFARYLGASPQEIEWLLCEQGFRIKPDQHQAPRARVGTSVQHLIAQVWRLARRTLRGDRQRLPARSNPTPVAKPAPVSEVDRSDRATVSCPRCGRTALTLSEQIPDHGLFRYECNACQTDFRVDEPPRAPMGMRRPRRSRTETREDRKAFLERFAERLATVTPAGEPPRTAPEVSKLHCIVCDRDLSDREWGTAQFFGGACDGCRGSDYLTVVPGTRDPGGRGGTC